MCASTRAAINARDFNYSQPAVTLARFSKTLRLGCIFESDADSEVCTGKFGSTTDHGVDLLLRKLFGSEFDSGQLIAHAETECRNLEKLLKNCREQMLPGMLLHVIVAACPVDLAVNG